MATAAAVFSCEVKSGSNYCLATFPGRSTRNAQKCRIVCKTEGGKAFRFGTRKTVKQEAQDTDDESTNGALNFGTKLLKFATIKGKAKESLNLMTTSSKKDLPLSLGMLRRSPDTKTVFVTGATGQIGARISQQLLRSGFSVRGGVRDLFSAQQLAEFASQYGLISKEEARRINAVEFSFEDVESIAKAIGNAGKVVVTVGPTEDGPRAKVTPKDALQVVEAASLANVGHVVVVVAEAGVGGLSNSGPLGAISGFFSKLFSKAAEVTTDSLLDSVVETDLRFTFVKASSTEGVDDFSPDGGSVVLLSEGTYNKGTSKVSKAQLASVVASIFANVSVAENKVLEVATISSDPKPIEELLSSIPEDGRRAALAEARAKAEAEENERLIKEQAEAEAKRALEEAKAATELANQLDLEAKKLAAEEAKATENAQKAKAKAKAAAASLENLGAKMKEIGVSFSEQEGGFGSFFKRPLQTISSSTTPPPEAPAGAEDDSAAQTAAGQGGFKLAGFGNFLNRVPSEASKVSTNASSAVKTRPSKASKPKKQMKQEALYADD